MVDPQDGVEQSDSAEVDVVGIGPETSAQVRINLRDPHEGDNSRCTRANDLLQIDDDASAETPQVAESAPAFETYHSLFDRHPLLRAPRQDSGSLVPLPPTAFSGSSSNANSADVDLKPLKQAAVLKCLSDNEGRVCQYDIGGECRDKDCENVHLSRLSAVEPSGTSLLG